MSFDEYLGPTRFLDADDPRVTAFAAAACASGSDAVTQAQALFLAVRDGFRYDPYRIDLREDAMRASALLDRGYGFCIPKAVLLAAAARARGIPSRLGFADVRNHLTTDRLRRLMRTDLFVYHGYAELLLAGRWVKATPAFDRSLCERFDVEPLAFDGRHDALLQQADRRGNRYMEYVRDRGRYADLPLADIVRAFREHYPSAAPDARWEAHGVFEDDATVGGGRA